MTHSYCRIRRILTGRIGHSEAGRRSNVYPASDPPVRSSGKGATAIMAHAQRIVTPTPEVGGV